MAYEHRAGELRRFGLLVGGVFAVIAVWPALFRGEPVRIPIGALAGALVLLGLVAPRVLAPVHRIWMFVGHALGWVNSRLLLGIVYYLVMTPIGILMRARGRDPMSRRLGDRDSYWVDKPPVADPRAAMERQF